MTAAVANAQNVSSAGAATTDLTAPPVAYVYVSSTPESTAPVGKQKNQVYAFAAAANGKLTSVPGSPFKDDIGNMVVNGTYLFGSTQSGIYVAAFKMQPNGALKWTTSTNIQKPNSSGCGSEGYLILDHTGSSLYDMAYGDSGDACEDLDYQSFNVDKSDGFLNYLGTSEPTFFAYGTLTFSANNQYAYQASCSDYRASYEGGIFIFKRASNGLLTATSLAAQIPDAKSGEYYCADEASADPANHVAIEFQTIDSNEELTSGLPRIAAYTADASGNLTTTSTRENMATAGMQYVTDMEMSPSGKLLAVAGSDGAYGGGLQILYFNGSEPITPYTGLLTKDQISDVYWDNANHLYAVSYYSNKLFVFTVTPTSVSQAPGSPYTIYHPDVVTVQPKTPRP